MTQPLLTAVIRALEREKEALGNDENPLLELNALLKVFTYTVHGYSAVHIHPEADTTFKRTIVMALSGALLPEEDSPTVLH